MSVSYSVSESFSVRDIWWALVAPRRRTRKPIQWHATLLFSAITLLWALLPDAIALGRGFAQAVLWCAGLALAVGAVLFVLAQPMLLVGLAITWIFAVVFKPRSRK